MGRYGKSVKEGGGGYLERKLTRERACYRGVNRWGDFVYKEGAFKIRSVIEMGDIERG